MVILSDQIWRVRCNKCYKWSEVLWSSKYVAERDIALIEAYNWKVVRDDHLCEICKDL